MTGNLVETAKDGRRELVLRFTNTYVTKDARWQLVAGQLTTLSRERTTVKVDPTVYAAYVGQYQNPSCRILTVSADRDKLWCKRERTKWSCFRKPRTSSS